MLLLFHILWYKIRAFLKLASEFKAQNIFKSIAALLVFGGFTIGAYFFSHEVITYVLDKIHMGVFLLHRFLSMVLYVFFLSINVGNIIVAYASLYRSKETSYYLTQPIGRTTLFAVKFIDTFFYSSMTLFLIAVAVLAGYGSYFHVSWVFYLQSLLLLFLPFMLLSASIGVITLLLLMKLARFIGIRVLFGGIVLAYIGILVLYFRMSNPMHLVNSVLRYYPYVDLYFGFLDPPGAHYVPSHWVAESLYWTIRGNGHLAFTNMAYLLVAAATSCTVMLLLAKLLYYDTWLISMELRAAGEARASRIRWFTFASKPLVLDVQTSALVKKEFWQFFREPSQWIHLGIIAVLMVIFLGSIRQINVMIEQPFLQAVSYLVIYVFNAFLISSIALRFVYPMISTEGPAFWSIRSAPVTVRKFFWMKFLFAALPMLFLGEMLIAASHEPLRLYRPLVIVAFGTLLPVFAAFIGLNLSFGAYFSDFKESNPIKIASSQGATMTFLMTVVLLIFLVAMLFFPIEQYFFAIYHGQPVPASTMYLATGIVAGIALIILSASFLLGVRSLKRDL